MKFTYTEARNDYIVDSALIADLSDSFMDNFQAGIVLEVKTCLENYNHELAKKLIDFHKHVINNPVAATMGMKLIHEYDNKGLIGIWVIE